MSRPGLSGWWRTVAPKAVDPIDTTVVPGSPRAATRPLPQSVTRTHVGRVRTINEDRVFGDATRGLWAVADGMGGHFAGDVAAETIVEALRRLADDPAPFDTGRIDAALSDAGRGIHERAKGSRRTSGSTVVALHAGQDRGTLFWAGDSRAYRARDGRLTQLTRDHSIVQELIDAGVLATDQAERHPQAHVITRALGATPEVQIERQEIAIQPGDVFLLCSDGLTRGTTASALLSCLDQPLDEMADRLMANALAAGGADNISLALIAIP